MKSIAERIKEGMEIRNLKQADLVEMTGISKGALSSYISGHYLPKQNNIFLMLQEYQRKNRSLIFCEVFQAIWGLA